MARQKRILIDNVSHHITARGTRRMQTFYEHGDYEFYLNNLEKLAHENRILLEAYCLMPNHVHLVLKPAQGSTIINLMQRLQWRHSMFVNKKNSWTGHLWQDRFFSEPLDEEHYNATIFYVESNPLRAKIVENIGDYPWASTRSKVPGTLSTGS